MNARTLTTGFLLLFLGASVAALMIKGLRGNSSAENAMQASATSATKSGADSGAEKSLQTAADAGGAATASNTPDAKDSAGGSATTMPPSPVPEKVLVYYFFGDVRCPTCMKIEAYTAATVQGRFATLIEDGALEWKPTNLDRAGNEHYLEDYQLVTKSVILSRRQGDKEIEWKNLDRIWELAGKKDQFEAYIAREVEAFVTGGKSEEGS
jgi:hypothetical protein